MAPYSLQMPAWLVFLRTLCALAEGAAKVVHQAPDSGAAACVLAVLADPQRRFAVMGGRVGMERSLGSVYGGAVTRFLGGFRGGASRVIVMPDVRCFIKGVVVRINGVAVSRDGSTLLISDYDGSSIHLYCVHTGVLRRSIDSPGSGPCQVWVATDGFVFVADCRNNRVQVLTPLYDFHSFVGANQLNWPVGVCADDNVIIVSEFYGHCLSVFNRNDGALLRRIGSWSDGRCDVPVRFPTGLCFLSGHRHVAVADSNGPVSVYTLEGEFVRHVGFGKLRFPTDVACSDNANELVVADYGNKRIVVFNASGEIVWTSEASAAVDFSGVTLHGSTIFGQIDRYRAGCVVFT